MAETQKVTIPVGGMTCQRCAASVNERLSAMPGVSGVGVDVGKGQVVVSGRDLDIPGLRQAIEDLGFDAGDVSV